MSIEIYLILLIAAFVVFYLVAPQVAGTYLKFRGKRVITCPETRKSAGVEVDATHAAITRLTGDTDLRLKSCSRWPERGDCGQACLLQVRLAPQDCLLRNILIDWYDDKHCVSCGQQFGEIKLFDHKPALLSPEGKTVDWSEIAAERVNEVLATHFPVCWDCHIVETFCREHSGMGVDRSSISAGVPRHMVR